MRSCRGLARTTSADHAAGTSHAVSVDIVPALTKRERDAAEASFQAMPAKLAGRSFLPTSHPAIKGKRHLLAGGHEARRSSLQQMEAPLARTPSEPRIACHASARVAMAKNPTPLSGNAFCALYWAAKQ
jgi:hypothetical protein